MLSRLNVSEQSFAKEFKQDFPLNSERVRLILNMSSISIRRVLISDAIDQIAIDVLKAKNIQVDLKTNLSKDQLLDAIKVSELGISDVKSSLMNFAGIRCAHCPIKYASYSRCN